MHGVNNWWDAPEYDKRAPMDFGPAGYRSITVRKDVAYVDGRWVATPIRIFVGPAYC